MIKRTFNSLNAFRADMGIKFSGLAALLNQHKHD